MGRRDEGLHADLASATVVVPSVFDRWVRSGETFVVTRLPAPTAATSRATIEPSGSVGSSAPPPASSDPDGESEALPASSPPTIPLGMAPHTLARWNTAGCSGPFVLRIEPIRP